MSPQFTFSDSSSLSVGYLAGLRLAAGLTACEKSRTGKNEPGANDPDRQQTPPELRFPKMRSMFYINAVRKFRLATGAFYGMHQGPVERLHDDDIFEHARRGA